MKQKFSVSLTLALIVAMLVTNLALADTVSSDVDFVTTGNQTLINLGIVEPNQVVNASTSFQLICAGKNHADFDEVVTIEYHSASIPSDGVLTAGNTTIGPIPAYWTDDTTGGGSTNCPSPTPVLNDNGNSVITITAPTAAGTYDFVVTYKVATSGGIDSNDITGAIPAVTFRLTVVSDTTPPVITPSVSPAANANGWHNTDVTVSWSVSDPESSFTINSGCATTLISYDTTGVTLGCSATSAGGTSSVSVTIKRDATNPSITASLSPASPAASGWYNISTGAPTVSFECDDVTSGVVACPGSYTFGEGANQNYSETVYDYAGNSASDGVSGIYVDLTAPTLTWSNGPVDGGAYYFGFVPATPTCSAADALSGPNGCVVGGYDTTVGTHILTATAYDVAGNSYSEQRTYTVLAWTLLGFYQPVDMNGTWNTVKGGSTVPFKFEVFAGSMELTDIAVVKSFVANAVACPTSAMVADEIEFTTTGGTSLRYDLTAGQFINNWQTPKKPGACYKVTMTTQDGSFLSAFFKLK